MMWRCFHCNAQFRSYPKAAEHFGASERQQPACLIDIAEYRRMEEVNRRHCEEDTELHREIYRLQGVINETAKREEEKGYARGLRDARGQFGVAVDLLRECVGPLEVSAAVIESEDGGQAIEALIAQLRKFIADVGVLAGAPAIAQRTDGVTPCDGGQL